MAKEDFCFTYYDGDAARDKAHLNRLERGAYDDVISAQRKFGHLTITQIKKVLSTDFPNCWDALEWVLKKDDKDKFYIEWVDKSIEKMRKHSEKQKENVSKRWKKDTTVLPPYQSGNTNGDTKPIPLEDGDEYVTEIISLIEKHSDVSIGEGEKKPISMLVLKMVKIFLDANPEYFFHKETDYHACLQIAYNIAEMKKWTAESVVNVRMEDCLRSWQAIVLFIKKDNWLGTRSLTDLSQIKEWQRLVQKMQQEKNGTNKQSSQQRVSPKAAGSHKFADKTVSIITSGIDGSGQ